MTRTRRFLFFVALFFAWYSAAELSARVSVNVPIGHWSYRALDKLTGLGLIKSDMRGTRPVTRLELGRLVLEAAAEFRKMASEEESISSGRLAIVQDILERLKSEFQSSIDELGIGGGTSGYVKPLEDVYAHYHYGSNDFSIENDKGQELAEDSNLRAGFSTHGVLFGHLGYYVNPEYRYSEDTFAGDDDRIDILEGYGKLEVFNIEFEAGRDSLWWGTGRHGSLILTDNAQPFDLVKISNPRPVLLPWIFKYLGLFKFVGFWTELENSRVVPEAEVLGMRFHFKPLPFFDIGFSRTIMMGGKGGPKGIDELDLDDWGTILSGRNIEGDLNTNQIGGLDIDLLIPNVDAWLPIMESINLWGEWYGEDEAGSLPSKGAYVGGLKLGDLFLTGRTDLIFEYATNVIGGRPGLWYSHSVYRTGYRYEGEIMGHNMGSDARDYFVRLEHYLRPELILSLDYNRQERGVEAEVEEQRDRYDFDLTYQRSDTLVLRAGYRYESIDNFRQVQGKDRDNNIFWLFVDYSF